jgi:hypothetical protein
MSDSQINVLPIACRLSNLTVFTTDADAEFPNTVLKDNQPFSLKVMVEFFGPGAIALVPLSPAIQLEFYIKPLGPDLGMVLGKVEIKTIPDLLVYSATLTVAPPTSIGLRPKTIYCVGVTLRVGSPDWPSLISGFTEELTLEVYRSSSERDFRN